MKNKNTIFYIAVTTLFLIATIITDILYIKLGHAYLYKTLASAVFVVCGVVNLILAFILKATSNKKYMLLMIIGQVFAFIGDILLINSKTFVLGAISFAIGHIFFFVAYCFIKRFKLLDLAYIGATIAVSMIIIFASGVNLGSYLPLVLAYAVIISFMLGKSATLFTYDVKIGLVVFLGSLMFYISDMFLMFAIFGGMGRTGSNLCLAFYYPAEFVLATSISLINILLNKKYKVDNLENN